MVCKAAMKPAEKKGHFKDRKSTVFKKAKELSTLCDVDLLLILYGPDQPNVPQFWCSQPHNVHQLITKYRGAKVVGNSEKKEFKNDDNNGFINNLGMADLKELSKVLEAKIEGVNHRITMMREAADAGFDDYFHANSLLTHSFNVDQRVIQTPAVEYDCLLDSGFYDQSLNLDYVQVIDSGHDCLLDSHVEDDLHNLLMGFEVCDFSVDDFEF